MTAALEAWIALMISRIEESSPPGVSIVRSTASASLAPSMPLRR